MLTVASRRRALGQSQTISQPKGQERYLLSKPGGNRIMDPGDRIARRTDGCRLRHRAAYKTGRRAAIVTKSNSSSVGDKKARDRNDRGHRRLREPVLTQTLEELGPAAVTDREQK